MSDSPRRSGAALVACALALTLWCAVPAPAQTLTGVISGTVVDPDGAPLPGVTVTISSPALISGTSSTTTDTNGQYRFPNLPPGPYEAEFALSGFTTTRRQDIRISAGVTATVPATMELAGVEEAVTIVGEAPLVDLTSSQTLETWGQDLVQNIPTSRTYVDINHLLPGVEDGEYRDVGPGASVVNGGTTRDNRLNIEGANVSSGTAGYPTTDLSYEVVQEVQAVTAGIAAEFGGASDAVFNVITKSGGNSFSAAGYYYYFNDDLQGNNITDEQAAQGLTRGTTLDRDLNAGVSLGGPILKNRAWFFGNYDRKAETANIINFPVPQDVTQNQWFGKITTQITDGHRVKGFHQRANLNEFPFIPQSVFADSKVYRVQDHENRIWSGTYTGVLNENTYVEITGNLTNSNRFQDFPNAGPDDIGNVDVATRAICCGVYRAVVAPGGVKTRQVKGDLSTYVSDLAGGSHDIKVGASWDINARDEIRDWFNGARRTETFNGEPFRIVLSNHPVTSAGFVRTIGVYAQDQWTIGDRLTLNLGLRYDSSLMWLPEGSSGGRNFPTQTFPREDIGTLNTISPRAGFAIDLFGDHSTVVTGNYGRYYEQVRPYIFEDVAPFAAGQRVWEWDDLNGDGAWEPGEEGALLSDSTSTTTSEVDPDLNNTYWNTFTLGIERQFGDTWRIGVTGIYRKENDIIETVDLALPFDEAYNAVTVTNSVTGEPMTVYALKPEFTGVASERFVTNPDEDFCSFCITPERNYKGLQFTFERRMQSNLRLFGSYTLSASEGNKGTHHRTWQGNLFSNPNNLLNSFGATTLDRTHSFKLQGTYTAPYDIWFSWSYVGQSGVPMQRDRGVLGPLARFTSADSELIQFEGRIDVLALPPGEERMDGRHLVDLRVEKRFTLGSRGFLGVIVDLRNAFNDSSLNFFEDVLTSDADFGTPGQLVLPRTLRLGARVEF